ncbi:hypothetical protein FIU94_15720 [Sulfitobacter sp. THAF37]|uniref:hypothetical protein n=1 Tax=Sulfitobacter sp. THAF37 TaxID=2587855 RepID=UPI001267F524|nr:hypothetical protein [Sulfitobacter sp. THAF37]QFT60276.1 hypothetical protein FIU94_15720 [Sulfitobacter sp. THAF37]
MKKTRNCVIALLCAALVAGCSDNKNRIAFDGKYFRTKVKRVDRQRDEFIATVRGVSQSFQGARGAALHAANAYCVGTYGSSDIDWDVGPDTPADQLSIVNDTLTYRGTCPQAQ